MVFNFWHNVQRWFRNEVRDPILRIAKSQVKDSLRDLLQLAVQIAVENSSYEEAWKAFQREVRNQRDEFIDKAEGEGKKLIRDLLEELAEE